MKVLANCEQGLSSEQKAMARANIGAQGALTAGSNIQIDGDTISATDTTYSAGDNVQINGTTISATDTKYTAGNGLNLSGTEFSVDTGVVQEKLTAGSNVQINGNTISATDTTYSAGSNVQINGTTISATDTTYSAGSGLSLNGTEFSVDTGTIQQKLTAGSNVQINGSTISATDTTYNVFDTTTDGLVPKSGANTAKYLKGDGTWDTPAGTSYSAGTGLTLTGTSFSVDNPLTAPIAADENKVLTVTDANGNYGWASPTGKRVYVTASEAAPYTRVTAIINANNVPVFVSSNQGATRYYELIYSSSSYYTFVSNDSSQFGNITYYVQINSDNTISSGNLSSQTPLSFESPWLDNDNGTIKLKWTYGTCIGTINHRTGINVTWTHGMTTTQFNQKLIDLPLPAYGMYVVFINGNGKFTDPSGVSVSQLLRFRVCNGYNTPAVNTIDGLAQIPISTDPLGFSCQLLVAAGATPLNTLTLNVSNDDYEPAAGQNQSFGISYLNVIWVRFPL